MSKRTILVTGTGGTGVGASVLAALQLPGARDRWETLATDANSFSWGLYAADHGELVPRADAPEYLAVITALAQKYAAFAIIPGTEAETVLLTACRQHLEPMCLVIANGSALMPLMRDKRQAALKLANLGLPHIPSYSWDRRGRAVAEFGFPLVIKPMKNTSGSRGLHLVTCQRELDAVGAAFPQFISAERLPDVQPYLGTVTSEYTVGVLSARDGRVIGSIAIRRELTGFTLHSERSFAGERVAVSTGHTQGYIVRNPDVQSWCEDLAVRLGSTGPLNLQLRMHDGQPHVFEIHPRFSGSAALRAAAGFNEPDLALRHWLDGEQPGCPEYAEGAAILALTHVLVPPGRMLS